MEAMNLAEQAEVVEEKAGKKKKGWALGEHHMGNEILAKEPVPRLGRPRPKPYEEEVKELEDLQVQLQAFASGGYEIICVDECIFTTKLLQSRPQFAFQGKPIQPSHQKKKQSKIAVVGFAGTRSGFNHWEMLDGRFFDRWDFIKSMKNHHQKMAGEKYVLFLDNASIHKAKDTQMHAEILDIPLVFNVPYRPDFNGIGYVWDWAKQAYQKRVAASLIGSQYA